MMPTLNDDDDLRVVVHKLHQCFEVQIQATGEYRDEMRAGVANTEGRLTEIVALIRHDRHLARNKDGVIQGEVHALGKRADRLFGNLSKQIKARDKKITDLTGAIEEIRKNVGSGTLAGLSKKQVITAGTVIAGLAAFPAIEAIYRFAAQVLAAANHAILTAPPVH